MDENGATHVCNLPTIIDGTVAVPASSATRPMYLVVVQGGIPGAMLRVAASGTRLGRAADNTLHLPDAAVSRHHAQLDLDPDGTPRLTDLGSTNGTFVNGRRIPPMTPVALRDGDRLRFGSTVVLKFARPDPCEEHFQRALFERSVRDPLTGLYRRDVFLEQISSLSDRGALRGLGLAVLLLDLDHFKRVNDTFGHDAGDAVLRAVAAVIRQTTRTEDLVARYGGEEFVVALAVANPDRAADQAERIRRSLAAHSIPVTAQGPALRITVSIGVAFAPAGCSRPPSELIADADTCLYQAKHLGRNRVVCGTGVGDFQPEAPTTLTGLIPVEGPS